MANDFATENITTQTREDITPDKINKLLYIEISPDKYRGFDKKILTQNLHSTEELLLICKFCNGIMKDAVSDRGENMCSSCSNYKSFGLYTATDIRNTVNKLQCECPLRDRGCKWLGTVSEVYDHIKNVCPKLLVRCSLRCEAVLHNVLLESHIRICPNRIVQCEYCRDHLESKQMNAHLCKCEYCEINCYLKCGAKIVGKNLEAHINTICPMAILECPYDKWGCAIKDIKRKDLKAHMRSNLLEHANISSNLISKLEINLAEGLIENLEQKKISKDLQIKFAECSRDNLQQKKLSENLQTKCTECFNKNMQLEQVSEDLQAKLAERSRENKQQKRVSESLRTQFEQCSKINLQFKDALQNEVNNLRNEFACVTFGFVTHRSRSLRVYVCSVLLILLVFYYISHF